MTDPSRPNFFISYNRADRAWAEWIAWDLEEAGYTTVLQAWDFRPGENFVLEMHRSATAAERTLAVLSPDYLTSSFTKAEWAVAFAGDPTGQGAKLVPVRVRECKPDGLLGTIISIDLVGLEGERASQVLREGVQKGRVKPLVHPPIPRSEAQGPRPGFPGQPVSYRSMAPPREPFTHRTAYDQVVAALLSGGGAQAGPSAITVALLGAGGFGKTALAQEACWDERVQGAYPDGVLWATMGETLDLAGRLSRVRDLLRWWNRAEPPAFETATVAGVALREALAGKSVLLVVDDVWRPEDLEPFRGLGPGSALLVTTRDQRSLPPDRQEIQVDAMTSAEAVALLAAGLPAAGKEVLGALAARLGEWPLLLKIVNRQIRDSVGGRIPLERAIREIGEALDAEGIETFELREKEGRESAAAWTIERSLQRLTPQERERYGQLAVFPEDKDVPLRILERLWGSGSFEVRKLCHRLHDLSLLLGFNRVDETIRLHDVLRAYLLRKQGAEIAGFHRRLLEACRPPSGRWQDLPAAESYLWRNLAYHLVEGGQASDCRDLLLEFDYLGAKLAATDAGALLADYYTLKEQDPEVRLVAGAIRLAAHILGIDRNQLAPQLIGRLLGREEPGIARLLRAAGGWRSGEWLRPLQATFITPGGALIRTFTGHMKRVNAVAVLNGRALSGSSDGTLRLWDLESGETLRVLEGHSGWVNAVALLEGERALSGSEDGTLRLWDLESRTTLRVFAGHAGRITALAVLADGDVLSGSEDGTLGLWNLSSGESRVLGDQRIGRVTALAVLDGERAAVCFGGDVLQLWDLKPGQILSTLQGTGGVQSIAALSGDQILCGSRDRTVSWLDLRSGQRLQALEGHADGVFAVAALDGGLVLSGSRDRTLRLWELKSGRNLRTLEGHTSGVQCIAALGDGRAVSGSRDATLRLWDLESAEAVRALNFHAGWAWGMASVAGGRVVSGSFDKTLKVWDLESGQAVKTLTGHEDWVWAVAVLDGRRIVSSSQDKTLRLWDLESGATVRLFEGHTKGVRAVAAVGDGRILSGSQDRTLRLWDVESGELLRTFQGHTGLIWTVVALNDGRALSGSKDGTLRLWDLESGECLRIFAGHTAEVRAAALLSGGRFVSGSKDGTLRVWDLESEKPLATLASSPEGVNAIAVLDEDRIVSGTGDTNLQLWSLEAGRCLSVLTLDASSVSIAFSTERQVLAVGDDSGRVHFLTVQT